MEGKEKWWACWAAAELGDDFWSYLYLRDKLLTL